MYKCQVCGRVTDRMPDLCPSCQTRNSYLPSIDTSSSQGGFFTKEEWDKKVNRPL